MVAVEIKAVAVMELDVERDAVCEGTLPGAAESGLDRARRSPCCEHFFAIVGY